MGTLVVGILLVAVVALIIRGIIRDRKNGKSHCGCDCSSCGGACGHKSSPTDEKTLDKD
jgi:hypothetical protein